MAIDDWDYESIRPRCPRCGSENVIVVMRGSYYFVVLCKKCKYRADDLIFEARQAL